MGGTVCVGKRDRMKDLQGNSKYYAKVAREEFNIKWEDMKENARERYEEAKFNLREKKRAEENLKKSPMKRKQSKNGKIIDPEKL